MPVARREESYSPQQDRDDESHYQNLLEEAVGSRDAALVRQAWTTIPRDLRKVCLLSPSRRLEYKLRTPFMGAAATGDMSIMGALLEAFEELFQDRESGRDKTSSRNREMERQQEILDINDMTLLMHASGSGCPKVFSAIAQEVRRSQFRKVILARDAKRRTFLHHAANANSDDTTTTHAETRPLPSTPFTNREASTPHGGDGETPMVPPAYSSLEDRTSPLPDNDNVIASRQHPMGTALETGSLDPWVPVVTSALEFADKNLWKAEYRKLLLSRDAWKRTIVEHSIMSGRRQLFETVFDAIREDIYDDEIDFLLDSGVESSYEQNAMSIALSSNGGQRVTQLLTEKAKSLKNDVSLRAGDSTVTSKIQAFIPGNLIVIFQLLLPEFKQGSDDPLILLLVLCAIAPFWSWGSNINTKTNPQVKNTRARQTGAKHILAIPAMFFWGVGTSAIGTASFDWDETASAAALAVATIVIPALDSFFTGRGARKTADVITIAMLNLSGWLWRLCPFCNKGTRPGTQPRPRTHTSSGDNRAASPRSPPGVFSERASVSQVPQRPSSDAMEAGGAEGIAMSRPATTPRVDRSPRLQRTQGSTADSIWEGATKTTG